jgi:VanZ family protein
VKSRTVSLLVAISVIIILTILLTLPGSALPKENWFATIYLDKWVHIVLFFLLVIAWTNALGKFYPTAKDWLPICCLIGLCAVLYGTGMEFVQKYFVVNRSFEMKDILADAGGSLLGILFSLRYIKK